MKRFILIVLAAIGLGAILSVPTSAEVSSGVELVARGSAGGEVIEVRANNSVLASYELTTESQAFLLNPEGLETQELEVAFTNDGRTNGIDRNVTVESLSFDGEKISPSDPSVFSIGSWSRSNGCHGGYKQSNTLHCNGYFLFPVSIGPTLEIQAYGSAGGERMIAMVDGEEIGRWAMTTEPATYRASLTAVPETGYVELRFDNDGRTNGVDRNLHVDSVSWEDITASPTDKATHSKGSWSTQNGCGLGFKQTDVLHCNGFFRVFLQQPNLTVTAHGATGHERMRVTVDGQIIGEVHVTTHVETYPVWFPELSRDSVVEVGLTNDVLRGRYDRNLFVDNLEAFGETFETESPNVLRSDVCSEGFYEIERINCDGTFTYLLRSEPPVPEFNYEPDVLQGLLTYTGPGDPTIESWEVTQSGQITIVPASDGSILIYDLRSVEATVISVVSIDRAGNRSQPLDLSLLSVEGGYHELAPDTVELDEGLRIEAGGDDDATFAVVVSGNPAGVGDHLYIPTPEYSIPGLESAVWGRVASSTVIGEGQTRLTLEAAPIQEVFDDYRLDMRGNLGIERVDLLQATTVNPPGTAAGGSFLGDNLSCTTSLAAATTGPIEDTLSLLPSLTFATFNWYFDFEINWRGSVKAELSTTYFTEVSWDIDTATAECSLKPRAFGSPPITVGPLTLTFRPEASISAKVTENLSFTAEGRVKITADSSTGFDMSHTTLNRNLDIDAGAQLDAFVGLDVFAGVGISTYGPSAKVGLFGQIGLFANFENTLNSARFQCGTLTAGVRTKIGGRLELWFSSWDFSELTRDHPVIANEKICEEVVVPKPPTTPTNPQNPTAPLNPTEPTQPSEKEVEIIFDPMDCRKNGVFDGSTLTGLVIRCNGFGSFVLDYACDGGPQENQISGTQQVDDPFADGSIALPADCPTEMTSHNLQVFPQAERFRTLKCSVAIDSTPEDWPTLPRDCKPPVI